MKQIERETMQAGALILGAGPAGLACAIRLAQRIRAHTEKGDSYPIAAEDIYVLEKAEELGMHSLSGAVVDLLPLQMLFPDVDPEGIPGVVATTAEDIQYLTAGSSWPLPWIPGELDNRDHHVVSLGQLVRWLGGQAEDLGISVFSGFAAASPILDNNRLLGAITDDKGLDKTGAPKSDFEPGYEIRSQVTVLAEGSRGSVSKRVIEALHLDQGRNPQSYALGVKEVWTLPEGRIRAGAVSHYFGYPIPAGMYGGGWLYALGDDRVSLGLMAGLQHMPADFDAHHALQQFKKHPAIEQVIRDGTLIQYGAKTIPVGGYWAMPEAVFDGGVLIGDAGGLFNPQRLKGVHAALHSGLLAGDAVFDALLQDDTSAQGLASYATRLRDSSLYQEHWRARNHHQALEHGVLKGAPHYLLQKLSGGRGMHERYSSVAGHQSYRRPAQAVSDAERAARLADKLNSVFHSGVRHEKDQPVHLNVLDANLCVQKCTREYGNPCTTFCPAGVYEMVADKDASRLKVNAENCVHCKTCDIMDPYENITWNTPEGRGGPRYETM